MKDFKRFLAYLTPYRKYQVLSICFNIGYALFSSISMLSLLPMIKVLFQEGEAIRIQPVFPGVRHLDMRYIEDYIHYLITTTKEEEGPLVTLVTVVAFVLSTFLIKNLFNYLALLFVTYLNNGVLKDLRQDVYQKLIALHLGFFAKERKGDLIARMTADIQTIKASFVSTSMMVREPLTILFTLIAMFAISWRLTVFVFFFIPISGFLISKLGKSIKKQSRSIFELEGQLLTTIEETLGGIQIIKNFTSEAFFSHKFAQTTERINRLTNAMGRKISLSSPVSEFLGILVISILLIYGGSLVLVSKSLSGGAFIAYMGLAYQILTPAKAIAKASHILQSGKAAYERVAYILDMPNPIQENPGAESFLQFNSEIKFENISFKYENEYVLQDFSLTIPKGKTVALVGESGSGKSTIVHLLCRFYDVDKGRITFDGTDIKQIKQKSLRRQLGIVSQDPVLFHDTLANNISLGVSKPKLPEIIKAAKIANAHGFISEMTAGYESVVGDRGGLLSGGQRQRIAIARAVFRNPPIMILDEATSALDAESEQLVQHAIENMMKDRTALVIAHRLSTIQNADQIVVLKKGKLVEQGTHNALIQKQGIYKDLVTLQALELR